MTTQEFYSKMRQEVSEYSAGREDTSAFLIWFLENYFRLELQDAIDCVCDHKNDKGIDGIFIDDEDEIIYLFQSKFSPHDNQSQGDNDIRNFVGSRQWFQNEETIQQLLDSTASKELKSLVASLKIAEKTNFTIISVFVTNKIFNSHAEEYIKVTENLEVYDIENLLQKYTYFADQEITYPPIDLFITNHTKIDYNLPDGTNARVYSIKAKELIKLEGIRDRTLFYKNVRYGVGKTRVNKSIKTTILDSPEHNNFFLYHNGITITCSSLEEDLPNNKITIGGYAVINGCQSMLTFFENAAGLSNNLYVLVKIIRLSITSQLIKRITFYANNQNSISLKDLRSNDSAQKSLQKEFEELFSNNILYRRKKGEPDTNYNEIVEKDFAAQIIEAIYRNSPHNTHLKQKLFGEEYTKIFSRKINAEKIYLGKILYDLIKAESELLENEKIRDYGLTIFFFSCVLSEIMRLDPLGMKILEKPKDFITNHKNALIKTLTKLWGLMTPDINININEYAEEHDNFFDYKNLFKNSNFTKKMSEKIKADYKRLVIRNIADSFSKIYESFAAENDN